MLTLYNAASGVIEPVEIGNTFSIYTCGVTPYDAGHIGHAATFLNFDVLRRHIASGGVDVALVRNITDVDDDMLRKARELQVHYLDLARAESEKLELSLRRLGALPPSALPTASSAIPEIRRMIGELFLGDLAYASGPNVYFDTAKYGELGSLFHVSEEEMLRLAPLNGADIDDHRKRNPLDFILWQESAEDEPRWGSPWGDGRPGWHIECSALCLREIGATVDVHGGGSDLRFPHHECEHAQSISANGLPLARIWMHQEVVTYEGTKMSKSLGNLVFIHDLLEKWDAGAIRLAIISHHYRESWEWTDSLIEAASETISRWRRAGGGSGALEDVKSALNQDLDVPEALASIDRAVDKGLGVSASLAHLGIE